MSMRLLAKAAGGQRRLSCPDLHHTQGRASSASGVSSTSAEVLSAANANKRSNFYDLINDLAREYDTVRSKLSDAAAENNRLRLSLERRREEAEAAAAAAACGALRRPGEACGAVALTEGVVVATGSGKPSRATADKGRAVVAPVGIPVNQGELLPQPDEPESPRPPPGDSPRPSVSSSATGLSATGDPILPMMLPPAPVGTSLSQPPLTDILMTRDYGTASGGFGDLDSVGERETFNSIPESMKDERERDSFGSMCGEGEYADTNKFELELHRVWLKRARKGRRPSIDGPPSGSLTRSHSSTSQLRSISSRGRPAAKQEPQGAAAIMRHFIMRPSSRTAIAWDCMTITVLVWDLVVIPLQAYELPVTNLWSTMEIAATVTWTIDIVLSFIKGFEVRGDIEMRPREIARHYIKTWFWFDVSIVSIDWILFVVQSGDLVDWLRFSRFRRALRLLRLARLVKHGARFLAAVNYIQSEDWLVMLRILWLLILLIAINHFISCGWYAIGTMGIFDDEWAERAFDPAHHDFAYRYTTAFHWSVTQFTPASMEVVPRNSLERSYNICAIFFGLLMFSSFVSNMTNSMTYLTKRNYDKRQQRDILMGYMNARGLSLDLRNDIATYLGNLSLKKKRALGEADITALRSLPEVLLERLHVEVHSHVVEAHSLFNILHMEEPAVVEKLCHHAMAERPLAIGEELFRFGVRCSHMYFMVSGTCLYTLGYGEEPPTEVGMRQWFCEACLWVDWEHRGRMNAITVCEMSEVDSLEFQTIMSKSRNIEEIQRYARIYALHAERENGGAEHVTDLWGQRLRVMDLVQKAFRPNEADAANPANKVMTVWCGTEFTMERLFSAWKSWAQKEKEYRGPGFFNAWRRRWRWCSGRWESTFRRKSS